MSGKKMVKYVFTVGRKVTVYMEGRDTDFNYEKAENETIQRIKNDIERNWLCNDYTEEFTDYEKENDYA